MYNRYIPQPDGSHRRNPVQTPEKSQEPAPPQFAREAQPAPCPAPQQPPMQGGSISSFFKNLLPKDLDTTDLLIILLLLLMAGDSEKNRNSALLTLALYFIL